MNKYQQWIEAFQIFMKYDHDIEMAIDNDLLYAGPDSKDVSDEDKERLDELGWAESSVFSCFFTMP